jgi:hypothetical protein
MNKKNEFKTNYLNIIEYIFLKIKIHIIYIYIYIYLPSFGLLLSYMTVPLTAKFEPILNIWRGGEYCRIILYLN